MTARCALKEARSLEARRRLEKLLTPDGKTLAAGDYYGYRFARAGDELA